MSKNKILFFLGSIVIVLVVLFIVFFANKDDKVAPDKSDSVYKNLTQVFGDQAVAQKMRDSEIGVDFQKRDVVGIQRGIMMSEAVYTHMATLSDVSGGKGSGIVSVGYSDKTYNLSASFAGLLEPENGNFYEGWIVRREPFDLISTGKLDKLGGVYSNLYKSETDLMEYDFYVLTIEPDDNDPAPGIHILEGVIIKK